MSHPVLPMPIQAGCPVVKLYRWIPKRSINQMHCLWKIPWIKNTCWQL